MHSHFASVVVLAYSLTACAQDTADKPPGPLQDSQSRGAVAGRILSPIRVIVQFKNSADFANEDFVQTLQTQTQAQVHYIGAVFSDTHVYGFQPSDGQSYAQLLQRLKAMPEVLRVEVDQKVKPQ